MGDDRPHVLVVEDDEPIRTILEDALHDEGYHVTTASDGLEALDHPRELHPDVILLDWRMRGMGGAAFLRARCQQRLRPETPVLILTAHRGLDPDAIRCNTAGVLSKPFELDDLLDTVAGLIPSLDGVDTELLDVA